MNQHRLLQLIEEGQSEDGSFAVRSGSEAPDLAVAPVVRTTNFATAFVTLCLAEVPAAGRVARRAAAYLATQASPGWTFSYWRRGSSEAAALPYPDDWDDTALCLAALTRVLPETVTGEVLALAVLALTRCEVVEGGPYVTWLVGPDAAAVWRDVDVAVNANIAYFLSLHNVELPSLVALVAERLAGDRPASPYYPSVAPVLYYLSRWYRGDDLRERVGQELTEAHNPLDSALLITAAANLGLDVTAAAAGLEALPEAEVIRAYPLCLDPDVDGRRQVAGSAELTAAAVLEALVAAGRSHWSRPADPEADRVHALVAAHVRAQVSAWPGSLHDEGLPLIDRVLANDPARQITLVPYLFRQALGRRGADIDEERLAGLGAASLYGWMAYTVYDDFRDAEGRAQDLPAANVAFAEVLATYSSDPAMAEICRQAVVTMEASNAWELAHTRVSSQAELLTVPPPDYGDLWALADRSIGHALAAVALLADAGVGTGSRAAAGLRQFFRHLLIARQLGDEAHDWKPDLERGQINAVGAMLLRAVTDRGRNVAECYDRMERVFWDRTILEVCGLIEREVAVARAELLTLHFVERPDVLEAVLAPIDETAHQARAQQRRTVDFLRTFHPGTGLGAG